MKTDVEVEGGMEEDGGGGGGGVLADRQAGTEAGRQPPVERKANVRPKSTASVFRGVVVVVGWGSCGEFTALTRPTHAVHLVPGWCTGVRRGCSC